VRRIGKDGRLGFAVLGIVVGLFGAPVTSDAATGDLDPSFGAGGVLVVDATGHGDGAAGVAQRPDGGIVVVGSGRPATTMYSGDLYALGVTATGQLDPTFGNGGIARAGFSTGYSSGGFAVAADGSLLLAGNTGATIGSYGFARLLTNGQLDGSFGTGGRTTANSGNSDLNVTDAAILPDGSIVAAATARDLSTSNSDDFGLTQLTSGGALDMNFGISGFSHADVAGADDEGTAMAVQVDGKIVRVGSSVVGGATEAGVTRVDPDGYFDTAFIGGGRHAFSLGGNSFPSDVALLADAKILVAGNVRTAGSSDLFLLRLNANGTADASFGTGGLKTIDFGGIETSPEIVMQSDGKIVIAFVTSQTSTGPGSTAIARLEPDGSSDPTFAGGGARVVGDGEDPPGLALQSNGDPLVAFRTDSGPNPDNFAVARIQGDGVAPQPEPTPGPEPTPANVTCAGKTATLVGTDDADKLNGSIGDDVIATLGGNDKVKAGKGDDLVCAGDGNDKVSGGPGKDVLRGEAGNDKLKGGGAKDTCIGGPGSDRAGCEVEHGA
jgi:uncharacterized delta-60 repeat protein